MEDKIFVKFITLFNNDDDDLDRLGIKTKEEFVEETIYIDITKVVSFNGGSRDNTTTLELVTGSRWTVQSDIKDIVKLFDSCELIKLL